MIPYSDWIKKQRCDLCGNLTGQPHYLIQPDYTHLVLCPACATGFVSRAPREEPVEREAVPAQVDALDVLLVLWIGESMLEGESGCKP